MLKEGLITSPKNNEKTLAEIIKNKDVFIGVSARNILTKEMVASMSDIKVVFAMANPDPEILPSLAKEAGAKIVGTGRSDYYNQINNVLVFPGLMKGVIESRSKTVTNEMKLNAMNAIADLVLDEDLDENYILPSIFDKRVVEAVADSVKKK
jgi:malate dehydrogenase (oxaloacetate-decarboxylating)